MILYAETSAVLAWLFGEAKSDQVLDAINSADLVVTSTLTVLEANRALTRALQTGLINEANCGSTRRIFGDGIRSWELMEIANEIQERVARSFPVEPVRSLDAIHLATILRFLELYEDVRVLTFDERIASNLPLLGIKAV